MIKPFESKFAILDQKDQSIPAQDHNPFRRRRSTGAAAIALAGALSAATGFADANLPSISDIDFNNHPISISPARSQWQLDRAEGFVVDNTLMLGGFVLFAGGLARRKLYF
jgi:hypothetical protein